MTIICSALTIYHALTLLTLYVMHTTCLINDQKPCKGETHATMEAILPHSPVPNAGNSNIQPAGSSNNNGCNIIHNNSLNDSNSKSLATTDRDSSNACLEAGAPDG